LTAAGCGESVPPPDFQTNLVEVTGAVTLDGKPTAGIQVGFVPREGIAAKTGGTVRIANGITDAEGKFSLTTPPGGGGDMAEFKGAIPGQYAAVFSLWTKPDGTPVVPEPTRSPVDQGAIDRMPREYGNPATTPHQVEVKSGQPNTFDFALKSK
jgi:hypothetical protein